MTRWGIAAGWVGLAWIVGSAGAASPSRAHFPVSATIVAHCSAGTPDIVARGIPAHKVTVIPNAVDVDKFSVGGTPDPTRAGLLKVSTPKSTGSPWTS